MTKKMVKGTLLAAVLGTAFQFGGCLGGFFGRALEDVVPFVALEFVTDNDGVFDLFAD